jgi:hypothetical protein
MLVICVANPSGVDSSYVISLIQMSSPPPGRRTSNHRPVSKSSTVPDTQQPTIPDTQPAVPNPVQLPATPTTPKNVSTENAHSPTPSQLTPSPIPTPARSAPLIDSDNELDTPHHNTNTQNNTHSTPRKNGRRRYTPRQIPPLRVSQHKYAPSLPHVRNASETDLTSQFLALTQQLNGQMDGLVEYCTHGRWERSSQKEIRGANLQRHLVHRRPQQQPESSLRNRLPTHHPRFTWLNGNQDHG